MTTDRVFFVCFLILSYPHTINVCIWALILQYKIGHGFLITFFPSIFTFHFNSYNKIFVIKKEKNAHTIYQDFFLPIFIFQCDHCWKIRCWWFHFDVHNTENLCTAYMQTGFTFYYFIGHAYVHSLPYSV